MSQKIKVFIIGLFVLIIAAAAGCWFIMDMFKANDEVLGLEEYYSQTMGMELKEDEAVLILQDKIQSEPVTYKDGEIYLNLDMVKELFNERFYWDYNENIFLYTLPGETIEIHPDETSYKVGGETVECNHAIVYCENEDVKILLSFVETYSDIDSVFYANPNRVVIRYIWGEDELVSDVKKDTQLRYEGSSKGMILKELSVGDEVTYIMEDNTDVSKGYVRVMTADGVIGYVKQSDMNESFYENIQSDFEEPVYENISKDYEINLTWNMVTNQTANEMMPDLLDAAQGVNTISPTWFEISDTEGNIASLADHDYVKAAHDRNVEVWALVDDFTPDVSVKEILTHTTARRNLVNNLISKAKEYDLDGLNIDFEYIKESFADDYIQFLRELSVECRKEKIVLSVDSYVPLYSQFYNRAEQGRIADYVIIMAYDEHDSNSAQSGSVSSISWVQMAIDQTLEQVEDKSKVIIGIPFYDRLWEEGTGSDGSTVLVSHRDLTMKESQSIISENSAFVSWDEETKQNYVEYTSGGHVFKMWVEDAKSIEEKMKVISEAEVGGIASWRLGQETNDIWSVINSYINK